MDLGWCPTARPLMTGWTITPSRAITSRRLRGAPVCPPRPPGQGRIGHVADGDRGHRVSGGPPPDGGCESGGRFLSSDSRVRILTKHAHYWDQILGRGLRRTRPDAHDPPRRVRPATCAWRGVSAETTPDGRSRSGTTSAVSTQCLESDGRTATRGREMFVRSCARPTTCS